MTARWDRHKRDGSHSTLRAIYQRHALGKAIMKRSKNKSNWFVSTSLVFFLTYQIIKEKFIHGWKGEDKRYELLASWVLARSPTAIAVNPSNDHILLSYWSNCWIEEYSPDGTIVRNIG